MPCLLVLLILAFPRIVLVWMYFTSTYLQRAYHDLIIPVFVNLIYLVVAVIIDLGGLGGGESHRRRRL